MIMVLGHYACDAQLYPGAPEAKQFQRELIAWIISSGLRGCCKQVSFKSCHVVLFAFKYGVYTSKGWKSFYE